MRKLKYIAKIKSDVINSNGEIPEGFDAPKKI